MTIPKELKMFFEKYEILIIDKNTSSRLRLMKTMIDLGAAKNRIFTCGHLDEARAELPKRKIGMVISDYLVGGGSGFDFFRELKESIGQTNKHLTLILVTSNMGQSAVAKAAEEDVDSFILKPYTVASIESNLTQILKNKIKPPAYMVKIDEGKKLLMSMELDKATATFQEACKLNPKPTLALFYIGQVEYIKKQMDQAKGNFEKGLQLNNIHFKCLMGLYDIFVANKMYDDAYSVVKKLAKHFPSNPDRLIQAIHLLVRTNNFDDIDEYYESFKELEERVPQSVLYMGAGLYVSGKYQFSKKKNHIGLRNFNSLLVSCSDFSHLVSAACCVLVDCGEAQHAEKFLIKINDSESAHYLVADFLVSAVIEKDPHKLLVKANKLVKLGVKNNLCQKYLTKVFEDSGLPLSKIEDIKLAG